MTLSKTDTILADIAANPGSTNKAVADRTGISSRLVSAITGQQDKKGTLRREHVASTASNIKIYAYWPVVENVPKAVENVPKGAAPGETKERRAKPRLTLDSLLDQFASAVALELTGRIKDRLVEELSAIVPASTTTEAVRPLIEELRERIALNVPPPAKARMPKVIIVGLLPAQAGMIQSEFHDVFDLGFWKDGTHAQLKDMVRGADHVVTFMSKISHDTTTAIEQAGKRPHHIPGGMTQLRDYLTALFVKEG